MHHSLSFADLEDPGDECLANLVTRYVQRMGLANHQWVCIVHRDKAHVHVHLAINRIGFDGEWWNATHDFERAQVVAGKVEVEFGIVTVPRPRLRDAIAKALIDEKITPPKIVRERPAHVGDEKHVMDEIRQRLERIPHGLAAPDWARAVEAGGLKLRASVGGEKISGFTVCLAGHREVKLSQVHRSLSWPKLLSSGRVVYIPEFHFSQLVKLRKDQRNDTPAPTSTRTASPRASDPERTYDPTTGFERWSWQPMEPDLVGPSLETGLGPTPSAPHPGLPPVSSTVWDSQAPRFGTFEAGGEGASSATGNASGIRRKSKEAAKWVPEPGPAADDVELLPIHSGSPKQLLGLDSLGGSLRGTPGDHRVDATPGDPEPQGPTGPSEGLGRVALPLRGSVGGGRIQTGSGDLRQDHHAGDLGWCGLPRNAHDLIEVQTDAADLDIDLAEIPQNVRQAAERIIQLEIPDQRKGHEFETHVSIRETLWEESQALCLTVDQYRRAKANIKVSEVVLSPARAIIRDLAGLTKVQAPEKRQAPPNSALTQSEEVPWKPRPRKRR